MTPNNGHKDFANWDLTSYFPTFDGPEYRTHRDSLSQRLEKFGADAAALGDITAENLERWVALLVAEEEISCDASHISSYIGCLTADDAKNEAYAREQAGLARVWATFSKAQVPVDAALKKVDDKTFEALATHPKLASARYSLERARTLAKRTMSPELETLTADLSVDGFSSWGRLYNTIAGKLEFEMEFPDGRKAMTPMAQKRTLVEDADPAVRKAAHVNSNKSWERVADSVAACLNGISGTRLTLNKYRKINHFLDVAMFQSGVEEKTIEQMWSTIAANREVAHNYLRRKAELLGVKKLGFQDLSAPLPLKDSQRYGWSEGCQMVLDAFDTAYPDFAEFTRMMIREKRIESEQRGGKRPGAFCTSSYKTRESRVYMTYGGSIGDVQTLAHELGHAFHNWVMRDMRPMQRSYPMTLAETASTFAEEILCQSLVNSDKLDESARAAVLNTSLNHAVTFMLDIHMRYIFEKAFYTERAKGEVSLSRLCAIMLDAQRECYGDTLDPEQMDPWFWASKLHFYITGVTFYNFPYTFGYLFSKGIYARFKAEGASFLPKYEALLRLTGSDTAEGVAQRSIGADLTARGFWQDALNTIGEEVAHFDEVVPGVLAAAR